MASEKQIVANRRNALNSTGPRTAAGKRRSRRNAFRHGLTAITIVETIESAADYEKFERKINADYTPITGVECALVARLASLLWRLRRAVACESGLLQIQAETLPEPKLKNLQLASAENSGAESDFAPVPSHSNIVTDMFPHDPGPRPAYQEVLSDENSESASNAKLDLARSFFVSQTPNGISLNALGVTKRPFGGRPRRQSTCLIPLGPGRYPRTIHAVADFWLRNAVPNLSRQSASVR